MSHMLDFGLQYFLAGCLEEKTAEQFSLKGKPVKVITEAQKKAGNYKKDHIVINGVKISIENRAGTYREGVDSSGKKWKTLMKHHYGYVNLSKGADGDHVDCFVNPDSKTWFMVYIINQVDPATGKFDEHKCMLGWKTLREAKEAYLQNYTKGWRGFGSVFSIPFFKFKKWVLSDEPVKGAVEKSAEMDMRPLSYADVYQDGVLDQKDVKKIYKDAVAPPERQSIFDTLKYFIRADNRSVDKNSDKKLMAARLKLMWAAAMLNTRDPEKASIPMRTGLHRRTLQKSSLSPQILQDLGFKKVLIAVPERGQVSAKSWRQPATGLHIHEHPDTWTVHKDKWTAVSVSVPDTLSKDPVNPHIAPLTSMIDGLKHLIKEGFTGWKAYRETPPETYNRKAI